MRFSVGDLVTWHIPAYQTRDAVVREVIDRRRFLVEVDGYGVYRAFVAELTPRRPTR